MFTKRKIRDEVGRFAKRSNKWRTFFIIAITIALVEIVILSDLVAGKVSNALYPVISPVEAKISLTKAIEPTIEEHICLATNGENCDVLVNLAMCESSMNKDAWHINTNNTLDVGLFQINSVHKDISILEKFDVYASARWANEKIKQGKGRIWVCWNKI